MPNKLMTRALIATMATTVVAVTGAGAGVAAAAPHPVIPALSVSGPQTGQPQQLWDSVKTDAKKGDAVTLKADSLRLLQALPHTYSANQVAMVHRAHALLDQLPVPPLPTVPSPTKAVCDLIASILKTLGDLVASLLGLPTTVPEVCSLIPIPPVPIPTPPAPPVPS